MLSTLKEVGVQWNRLSGALPSELGKLAFVEADDCHLTIVQCLNGVIGSPSLCGGDNNTNAFECPVPAELTTACSDNLGLSCQ